MRRIFHRMFGGVGIFFRRLFGLGIPLWFVLLMVLGSLFATRIITRNQVVQEVGGKDDYDEAMRYIEIKDITLLPLRWSPAWAMPGAAS